MVVVVVVVEGVCSERAREIKRERVRERKEVIERVFNRA